MKFKICRLKASLVPYCIQLLQYSFLNRSSHSILSCIYSYLRDVVTCLKNSHPILLDFQVPSPPPEWTHWYANHFLYCCKVCAFFGRWSQSYVYVDVHSATYYEIRNNDLLKHLCVYCGLTWLRLKKALTVETEGLKQNT